MIERGYISPKVLLYAGLVAGLAAIVACSSSGMLAGVIAVMFFPAAMYYLIQTIRFPIIAFYGLFILNYFIASIIRYGQLSGFSVIMDIGLFSTLFTALVHSILTKKLPWSNGINMLTIGCTLWAVYCFLEVVNPTAVFEAWSTSRGLIYNGLLVAFLGSVLIDRLKYVKHIVFILSVLVLLAALKALIQKYIGFDPLEKAWLAQGGAKTHIIATGTRYFSFFTDAGNLGSNMGMAGIFYGIVAIYSSNRQTKIYYSIVALLGIYAMFLSGTRGAMAVPLGGLVLFGLISKKANLVIATGILGIIIYVFFAHTYIGQGNPMIRRMRTAFTPTEDASFNVRAENKKKLAVYLRKRPFGEGLGLGGVEAQRFANRVTTTIPHDSTYVKLWMETGIVGLCLYLGILIASLLRACHIVMFRVKNNELRGLLTAMLCGVFGLMISAYGNAFFNQFPTQIIVFTFLATALNGQRIDSYINNEIKQNK